MKETQFHAKAVVVRVKDQTQRSLLTRFLRQGEPKPGIYQVEAEVDGLQMLTLQLTGTDEAGNLIGKWTSQVYDADYDGYFHGYQKTTYDVRIERTRAVSGLADGEYRVQLLSRFDTEVDD